MVKNKKKSTFSVIQYVIIEIIRNIAPRITRKNRKKGSWIF